MSEIKLLVLVLLAMALLAALWYFGWFGPITDMFLHFRKYAGHS